MKPTILATIAVLLYAVQNVILEQKLSRFSIVTLIICFDLVILSIAFTRWGFLRASGMEAAFPSGAMLALTIVTGVVYFFADYCYLAAYANGGTLMSVTTIAIMLPVFASLAKFAWTRELPTGWHVAGYALAVTSIFLVARGER